MTGIPFLLVFILAVALMIVMISRWKIHPFLSIMVVDKCSARPWPVAPGCHPWR